MGGVIREAPDAIISEVKFGKEHPLLAIEYSGALAAGNQAWQRNGRAYSSGLAQDPLSSMSPSWVVMSLMRIGLGEHHGCLTQLSCFQLFELFQVHRYSGPPSLCS